MVTKLTKVTIHGRSSAYRASFADFVAVRTLVHMETVFGQQYRRNTPVNPRNAVKKAVRTEHATKTWLVIWVPPEEEDPEFNLEFKQVIKTHFKP